MEITAKSVAELHQLLTEKKISATELVNTYLNRIEKQEPQVKAYITLTGEEALAQAQKVDEKIAQGEEIAPLEGIPMALKDNLSTSGVRTTSASKMLENYVPIYNATVVDKLRQAGAIMLGKVNMDEFAMGASTESSAFFETRNPWNLEYVPGGSSGGSAAVVAAEEATFSLGSDTGGSIRLPASYCNVVGLKPTYGRVSRYGLISYASSLDQIGPLTRTVRDNALVLNAIAGHDPKDSTSHPSPGEDFTESLVNDIKGLKIGVIRDYLTEELDSDIKKITQETISKLKELGAEVEECSLPHSEYALGAYYLISTAEASSNLARFDGVRFGFRAEEAEDVLSMFKKSRAQGFGDEVKRRILLGTYALSSENIDSYFHQAQKVRTLIKEDYRQAFEKYDVLLSSTSPCPVFKLGEKADDSLKMCMTDFHTVTLNLAGLPGISVPAGFSNNLPVGIQFIGKPFAESTLYRVAYTFEQNTEHHQARPALVKGV
ncbi:MAG: Asp-tRNA(Asn)/Glu-tRNA(Gln) amidotransferase subunit GatA [Desulfitobacterium sp.]|nr:Asp-tRNA(Asn)/Glu-tRNA(Gln) amidotransferase subunit GatA [Desulfitobacterium sp.]